MQLAAENSNILRQIKPILRGDFVHKQMPGVLLVSGNMAVGQLHKSQPIRYPDSLYRSVPPPHLASFSSKWHEQRLVEIVHVWDYCILKHQRLLFRHVMGSKSLPKAPPPLPDTTTFLRHYRASTVKRVLTIWIQDQRHLLLCYDKLTLFSYGNIYCCYFQKDCYILQNGASSFSFEEIQTLTGWPL